MSPTTTRRHSSPSSDLEHIINSNPPKLSKRKTAAITTSVACSTLLSAIVNGMFTIEIPSIAKDVQLSQELLLWPQTVVSLVSACTLLLSGSVCDVLGSKNIYLVGSFLQSTFILGAGLAQTGPQILVFRGFMGLAQSMCLTSSVSIIMTSFPAGRRRNVAFACMGGGQPIGFSVGLLLAGILTQTIGWRFGMYLVAGINFALVVLAAFGIDGSKSISERGTWVRFKRDIDWVGTLLASASLAMLSYVLASIAADTSSIKSSPNISLLCISIVLAPAFTIWMHHQVRYGRTALIPNSLWRNRVFSSICLNVFFTWGAFNSFEQLLSLWLQLVQQNSPLQTSIRFLPQTVVGLAVNTTIGLFVDRFSVLWIIVISTTISLPAPILLAVSGTDWIYWAAAFPAISLNVVGADSLYTVANLLISSQFPEDAQGLTGGVFNTMAQVGKSVGLALTAVISDTLTKKSTLEAMEERLAEGYRGSLWFCFALNVVTLCISVLGLRNIGKIGENN